MAQRSADIEEKTYFRSQRIFCMNGQWYFATREGEHGPYPERQGAEAALGTFVCDQAVLDGFQRARLRHRSLEKLTTGAQPMEPLERPLVHLASESAVSEAAASEAVASEAVASEAVIDTSELLL